MAMFWIEVEVVEDSINRKTQSLNKSTASQLMGLRKPGIMLRECFVKKTPSEHDSYFISYCGLIMLDVLNV